MRTFLIAVLFTVVLSSCTTQSPPQQVVPTIEPYGCVPSGSWVLGESGKRISINNIIPKHGILLAGEMHTDMPTHLWQYYLVVEAYNKNPDMVITMESFPRSTQPILDKWTTGDYGNNLGEFYKAVNWKTVWGYDIFLYEPLLRFAQQNNIPIIGMNVDKALIKSIKSVGWDNTPIIYKENLSRPAEASADYIENLKFIYKMHQYENKEGAPTQANFITAQTVWDRAFAESIAENFNKGKLVVAIVGQGHVQYGWGIEHQLKQLGITKVFKFAPWHKAMSCEYFNGTSADIFYGI